MLEICVLGSGSKGNSIYVCNERTGVLIDAGLSLRQVAKRLQKSGKGNARIDAVLLTHEHSDHIAHAEKIACELSILVYMSAGTPKGFFTSDFSQPIYEFESGSCFTLNDFEILSVPLPHDARDPVGFVISDGERK
ncbi:MAG: MBL fold metallo-hydrolase, partial [Actinomycetota bacterium]|nr:MBL fold metallo-hydrolase [Actinomycetota bacterium]